MTHAADPPHLPGIGRDASESSLLNSMMGNGMYVDQSSTQHALSPEDIVPLSDHSLYQSGLPVSISEDQLAQTQSLQGLHVQKQPVHLSSQISLSSDAAQNTCLPVVGQPERKSLGEDSVNDYTVKEDDTMDDILRFLLKVMVGCNQCICVCCMYLCMTMSCAGLSAALLMFMLRCVRTIRVIESCKLSLPFHQSMAGPLVPVMCCSAKR